MKSFMSRKFIVFAVSVVMLVVNSLLGHPIDKQTIYTLIPLVASWLVGQGIADRAMIDSASKDAEQIVDVVDDVKEKAKEYKKSKEVQATEDLKEDSDS